MMRWRPRSTARKLKAEKACIRNAFLARKNANEVAGTRKSRKGRLEMD